MVCIDWRNASAVTSAVVAVLNLVGTLGSNRCVLVDAYAVTAGLIYSSVEVSTNGFASTLELSQLAVMRNSGCGVLTWTMPTPFLMASPIPLLE